jgi:hypothetical protein
MNLFVLIASGLVDLTAKNLRSKNLRSNKALTAADLADSMQKAVEEMGQVLKKVGLLGPRQPIKR